MLIYHVQDHRRILVLFQMSSQMYQSIVLYLSIYLSFSFWSKEGAFIRRPRCQGVVMHRTKQFKPNEWRIATPLDWKRILFYNDF